MRLFLLLIIFLVCENCFCQVKNDSIVADKIFPDSSLIDSNDVNLNLPLKSYQVVLNELLAKNTFIHLKESPVNFINSKKQIRGKEYLFYLLCSLLIIFGFFKVFYARYFNNIFRVFFNTSLRQNQLTDILLQARLPSLIFNLFFVIMGGLYLWFLLHFYMLVREDINQKVLLFCIISVGIIYISKYCVMKFIGWATGMKTATDTYIFVIFLVNKILGVVLIPVVLLFAFSASSFSDGIVIISFLIIGAFFILRFLRSYGLLQYQLSLNLFHFLLYIVSIEILPLLIAFKWLLKFLY